MGRGEKGGRRENLVFGLLMITFGFVFLAQRFDLIEWGYVWEWWPLILVALGASQIIGWSSAKAVGSGTSTVLFGFWLLASVHRWYGLSWHNSWPIVFVAMGTGMVVRSLLGPAFDSASTDAASKEPASGGNTGGVS
jgi:hypothetical protein